MPRLSRTLPLLALIALSASCDGRVNGLGPATSNPDRTAPTVVSTVPSNGATLVPRAIAISITFSEPMATASMIASTFSFNPSIAGTVSYTGNTATFVPSAPLAAGAVYAGTVSTAAEDRSGNNLVAPFNWSFSTAQDPVVPAVVPR